MPSTKFPLHLTYLRPKMAAMVAIMDMVLMEMLKMWKVADGQTDEGWTMVNRPWHKLTIEDLHGCCGGHPGYCNKRFSNSSLHVAQMLPTMAAILEVGMEQI